jgi:hypothetical protein
LARIAPRSNAMSRLPVIEAMASVHCRSSASGNRVQVWTTKAISPATAWVSRRVTVFQTRS